MSYAEMCLLRTTESSLLVTLSKRRMVDLYSSWLADRGYRVYDLNLVEPETGNVAFDPMHYIEKQADVIFLAQSIVMANPRKETAVTADPFWDDAAISLLASLIAYQIHIHTKPRFEDVYRMFSRLKIIERGDSIETTLDDLFDRVSNDPGAEFAFQCWKTFRYAPMRTAGSIYSSLSVTMDTLFSPELRATMCGKPSVDFTSLTEEKSVLFVTTSAVNPSLDAFADLFYSTAVKNFFEYAEKQPDHQLPNPVHLLCDDFAVGARIPNFAHYISVFREKRISVSILLQSESQLRSMYGDADATTILNNCDRYVYMGGSDIHTAKNIAERLSIPLTDVLYMPLGSEYVFERGHRPILTERFHITDDPLWQRIHSRNADTTAVSKK